LLLKVVTSEKWIVSSHQLDTSGSKMLRRKKKFYVCEYSETLGIHKWYSCVCNYQPFKVLTGATTNVLHIDMVTTPYLTTPYLRFLQFKLISHPSKLHLLQFTQGGRIPLFLLQGDITDRKTPLTFC